MVIQPYGSCIFVVMLGNLINTFVFGCGFVLEFCLIEIVIIVSVSNEKMPDSCAS